MRIDDDAVRAAVIIWAALLLAAVARAIRG